MCYWVFIPGCQLPPGNRPGLEHPCSSEVKFSRYQLNMCQPGKTENQYYQLRNTSDISIVTMYFVQLR